MTNPSKYFRNNVASGLNLLDAAVEIGVKKFVFSSTCATYGPPDRVPMTEDLPQRPINPYGESKLMFEKMLIWFQQLHKLEFVAFRYFNAAGASGKFVGVGVTAPTCPETRNVKFLENVRKPNVDGPVVLQNR